MERHEVLEIMATRKLAGLRAAFDERIADGLKRRHPVQRIIGELLKAAIADKRARSIKYQMSVARLPLARELADFKFTDTPVNEPLVRQLAAGGFLANQRNAVPIGEIGTGKSHLAVAIARACIRDGDRSASARSPRWAHRNLPRALLRQPRGGHAAARGSLLWTTWTTSTVPPQRGQHCTPIGG